MTNEKQKAIYGVRASATLTSGWWKMVGLVCLVLVAATVVPAQDEQNSADVVKFKSLFSFNGTDGSAPFGLAQGTDGNLYGAAYMGGANGVGTVFKMTPAGTLTTIWNFCSEPNCADGVFPTQLVLGTDGNFYSTAEITVFRITPSGMLTPLYTFCESLPCPDGSTDFSGVAQGADGNFYGAAVEGGANNNPMCNLGPGTGGCGTVFRMTRDGGLSTIYNFCSQTNCTDGYNPYTALVSGSDGDLYGISSGGAYGFGTIFKITLGGKLTTLHSFDGTDGSCLGNPPNTACELIQGANGKLYGTAFYGGYGGLGNGTLFEITPGGTFTTLYNFCSQPSCADGLNPFGLLRATDGNLYGVTEGGGPNSCSDGACGTLFKLTLGGTLTTLHSFDGSDGGGPVGLVQDTNGAFYGTTFYGGTNGLPNGDGTVFALSVGLGPFVKTLPTSGKEEDGVRILGTDLTSAISVRFNGKEADFKVVSPTEIVTRVPDDARTGFVTVTTPNGTLKSNVKFRVRED